MNKRTITGIMMLSSLLTACSTPEEKKTEESVSVDTEIVSAADAQSYTSTYVGEVEAQASTAVSFSGCGTVTKVLVSEGQHVSKGQAIAMMDDTQSRNSLLAAEAVMTQSQDAYDRMKILHDRQSLSEMEWVQVQSSLQQAKSNLQKAQKALSDCLLTAPCSGVVGSKMLEAGMTALPAQPVCSILDMNRVKVKISVPEKEITSIASNATVCVDALDGRHFESSGMERGVTADAVSRTYEVRYLVDNSDGRLLPGMVCSVMPLSAADTAACRLSLPITSVQQSGHGQKFVWTVIHGRAHRTMVTVGKARGNRICILSGIKEGDTIVTAGYQKLYEKCKVR